VQSIFLNVPLSYYLLKEEFRLVCEKAHDRQQAERFLRAWIWKAEKTGDRFLSKFVKTLRNWWHEILNYFHHFLLEN